MKTTDLTVRLSNLEGEALWCYIPDAAAQGEIREQAVSLVLSVLGAGGAPFEAVPNGLPEIWSVHSLQHVEELEGLCAELLEFFQSTIPPCGMGNRWHTFYTRLNALPNIVPKVEDPIIEA